MQITSITTDNTLRELRTHGTSTFPFQYNKEDISQFDIGKIDWHWHREFEIVKVTSGIVFVFIGNTKIQMKEGQALFINTGVIHSLEAESGGIITNILFTSDFIAPENSLIYNKYFDFFYNTGCSHILLTENHPWQKSLLTYLEEIFLLCEKEVNANELKLHIYISLIWEKLYEHRNELVNMKKSGISLRTESRLRLMLKYIDQNYYERITLADIADAANISKTEAIRCFHAGMMASPIKTLNQYRLDKAKVLLTTTEDTVTNIASKCGFDNCSYFNRIFKQTFSLSPNEYRKHIRSTL